MIITEPYINFLIEHNLTQQQYLMLHLLWERRLDLIKKYKTKFPEDNGLMISNYLIQDLEKRNFITRTKKGFELGKKFLEVFIDKHRATDEIYRVYPNFIVNDGINIPLTSMDRNTFAEIYIKKINGSYEEHLEIVKDINFANKHSLIRIGLTKFLSAEYWRVFRVSRKQEEEKLREHPYTPDDAYEQGFS